MPSSKIKRIRFPASSALIARLLMETPKKELATIMGVTTAFIDQLVKHQKRIPPKLAAKLVIEGVTTKAEVLDAFVQDARTQYLITLAKELPPLNFK